MDKKAPVIFKNTFSYKLIYIFAIPDDAHAGCLKIGDTTVSTNLQPDRLPPNCHELNQAAQERIKKIHKYRSRYRSASAHRTCTCNKTEKRKILYRKFP